jgi:uncharacterized membrane protein YphA (DoxX/SURF4 family)
LILIVRTFIGVLFIFYGISKVADPSHFANEIGNYDMLPEIFIQLMALVIPWIELIVGLLLLFGAYQKENGIIATGLLIVFTLAVIIAFSRGLDISCGCSGSDAGQKVGWLKIFENVGLIILTTLLSISKSSKFQLK